MCGIFLLMYPKLQYEYKHVSKNKYAPYLILMWRDAMEASCDPEPKVSEGGLSS